MSTLHYTPLRRANPHDWYFTSPLGVHEDSLNLTLCQEMIRKVRARHEERARCDGFEAEMLRKYFESEQAEEERETPIPDREYDFARDQEIIADYEATKRHP